MTLAQRLTRAVIAIGDVSSLAFPIAFALTVYEVVARFVFNSPTVWTLEIALLITGIAYILTGPQTTALGNHIRIDVVTRLLPPHLRRWTEMFGHLMTAIFGGVVAYSGWRLAEPVFESIERTGSALNSPAPTIVKVLIPLAGVLIAVQASVDLVRTVKKHPSPNEADCNVD
jgi:TRAP-type C4-dicarboxylate transport system permease small subunit